MSTLDLDEDIGHLPSKWDSHCIRIKNYFIILFGMVMPFIKDTCLFNEGSADEVIVTLDFRC